ncbi:Uncharacterised protein [Mycobacteroides abscessus subsp. abscessus]|nr:Uncharacterised protein [Mycobacteroides abscessus subsp. abscessus]
MVGSTPSGSRSHRCPACPSCSMRPSPSSCPGVRTVTGGRVSPWDTQSDCAAVTSPLLSQSTRM